MASIRAYLGSNYNIGQPLWEAQYESDSDSEQASGSVSIGDTLKPDKGKLSSMNLADPIFRIL